VQFLPIVDRELRVAAHHSRTWWRRVLVLLIGLVVLAFVWLTAGRWSGTLSQLGHTVFIALSVFGFIYALLGGPLATADCLSRERREGTLGLLFLTDLRGYDIVLGKLTASSLDIAYGLVAALPLLAMPVLAGGVSLAQFSSLVFFLFNVMLLSLALGVCTSSFLVSGRASLALTFGVLLFLNLGLPFLGEEILKLGTRSATAGFFYMCCPYWGLVMYLEPSVFSSRVSNYWLNAAGTQGLAWILLAITCFRTSRHWRETPDSKLWGWWHRFSEWRRSRNPAGSIDLRRCYLDYNPVAWVEGRDRVQENVLALLVGAGALFCIAKHTNSLRSWPSSGWVISWPLLTHYLLCLWVAIQAPRRFADDRNSGALELLLCTPLPAKAIVKGTLAILWRRFGRALVAMVLLDGYLVHAYLTQHGGWSSYPARNLVFLYIYAAIVFPIQGYCMARVGLYHGLAKGNSLRATFTLIWGLGLLPWALFIAFLIFCDWARRYLGFLPRLTEQFAFLCWAGAHLLVFAVFLARASWELRCHFRELAAGTAVGWWKRLSQSLFEDFY